MLFLLGSPLFIFMHRFLFLFAVIFSSSLLFADIKKKDFSFELLPYFELSKGHLDEYIYSSSDDSIKKSKLQWYLNPLYKIGLGTKINLKNIFITTNADFAIPANCGTMCDSDWDSLGTIKTIYSELQEKADLVFNSSVGLGYYFNFYDKLNRRVFYFSPLFCFDYNYFNITSNNGHGYYGSEDYSTNGQNVSWDSEYATYHKVYGIDLERVYYNFFTGIECNFFPTEKLSFGFNFNVSIFTKIITYDKHHFKDGWFSLNGFQQGNFEYFKISIFSNYRFSNRMSFLLALNLLNGNLIKGDFYHNYYSSKPTLSRQKSGSSTIVVGVKAGIKILVL